ERRRPPRPDMPLAPSLVPLFVIFFRLFGWWLGRQRIGLQEPLPAARRFGPRFPLRLATQTLLTLTLPVDQPLLRPLFHFLERLLAIEDRPRQLHFPRKLFLGFR